MESTPQLSWDLGNSGLCWQLRRTRRAGYMVHICNPSMLEGKVRGSELKVILRYRLGSGPAWSAGWVPGRPGLHRETLFRKIKQKHWVQWKREPGPEATEAVDGAVLLLSLWLWNLSSCHVYVYTHAHIHAHTHSQITFSSWSSCLPLLGTCITGMARVTKSGKWFCFLSSQEETRDKV